MIKYSDDIKSMNLWEKISQISSEIEYLQKDDKIGFGASQYKAISIEKVMIAVSEKMVKYGIVIYPIEQEYIRKDEEVTKKDGSLAINRISDVNVKYQVVNIHNPAETFFTVSSGTGVDTQDKGIGKAMTYSWKNMLIKLFSIATGLDSDKVHSDDYTRQLLGEPASAPKGLSEAQLNRMYVLASKKGLTKERMMARIKEKYNCKDSEMTKAQYDEVCSALEK